MRHCRTLYICFIIVLYGLLQGFYFQEAGAVGEVAIGWSQPPNVIIQTHPIQYDDGEQWGPLKARQTRPTEIIQIGNINIPLAINS
ncbi:MAG: hypothetical protein CL916_02675, partial [Deltaproteobacteria bacterium]|nr:hypothetical protein [Deltaproteobacteria bacterium]